MQKQLGLAPGRENHDSIHPSSDSSFLGEVCVCVCWELEPILDTFGGRGDYTLDQSLVSLKGNNGGKYPSLTLKR